MKQIQPDLSHVNAKGEVRMVDVSEKPITARYAIAEGSVQMLPDTVSRIVQGTMPKGEVLATARIAAVMAAKRTHELIPMCHPIALTKINVSFVPIAEEGRIGVVAEVHAMDRTGVEMEAMTAVSIACLTIYDMVKAVDKGMHFGNVRLIEKGGGRSGLYRRKEESL